MLTNLNQINIEEALRRISELETQLDAWHNIFGTSQLSHASARLEQAESTVRRQAIRIEELTHEVESLNSW